MVPTLHELCDLPVKRPQPGQPLFEAAASPREALFAVCARSHSVTVDGRWRLHLPKEFRRTRFGVEPELYDLERDPGELRNLAVDEPDVAKRLHRELFAWEKSAPKDLDTGAQQKLDDETLRKLRALGYAQ